MEEKIVKEIVNEYKLGKAEKILVKVFVNICKYHGIKNKEKILKYVKNTIKI